MAKQPDDRHNNGNTGNKAAPVLHAGISDEYEAAIIKWGETATPDNVLPIRSEMIRQAVFAYIEPTLDLLGYEWKYIPGTSSDLTPEQQFTADWLTGKYLNATASYAGKSTNAMLAGDMESVMAIIAEQSEFMRTWCELNPNRKGDISNALTMARSIPNSRTLIERAEHNLGVLALEQSLVEPERRTRRTKEQIAADKAAEAANMANTPA